MTFQQPMDAELALALNKLLVDKLFAPVSNIPQQAQHVQRPQNPSQSDPRATLASNPLPTIQLVSTLPEPSNLPANPMAPTIIPIDAPSQATRQERQTLPTDIRPETSQSLAAPRLSKQ